MKFSKDATTGADLWTIEKIVSLIDANMVPICRLLSEFEQPWGITQNGGWYDRLVYSIHADDQRRLKENKLSIDDQLRQVHRLQASQIHRTSLWSARRRSVAGAHRLYSYRTCPRNTWGEYPKWSYGDFDIYVNPFA